MTFILCSTLAVLPLHDTVHQMLEHTTPFCSRLDVVAGYIGRYTMPSTSVQLVTISTDADTKALGYADVAPS
jgi:hypothetical protein